MRFALKRLGFYLIAAAVSIVLNFLLPRMMPGDPIGTMFARFRGKLSPESLDALKQSLGYTEQGLWPQFCEYLAHLARGDLGLSIAYFPTPVTEVIATGLGWTLWLAGVSVVISFTLGTGLGALLAWRRGGRLDSALPPIFALIGAFPYFWLAMLLLWLFGFTLGWFPLRHAYGDDLSPEWSWLFISDMFRHVALPAASIVLATIGGWMLSMRNTMITVLGEDYITLARAKGLSPRRVMLHYAARNALLPNITSFGMAIGFIFSGSLLTEIVFSYPGQGYLLVQAVRSQDYPLMQGLFLTITIAVLAANWLVDLVYGLLDPRAERS